MMDFQFESIEDLEKAIESLTESITQDEKALEVKREKLRTLSSMAKMIRKLDERREDRQNEALATLITQRDSEGRITDADFLQFSKAAGLSCDGLIDDPGEPDNANPAQTAA